MARYLDIIRRAEKERAGYDQTTETTEAPLWSFQSFGHTTPEPASTPYVTALAALRERCPDHVEPDCWQRAVIDGERFLAQWGEQAQALGWTARDLFGLHTPCGSGPTDRRAHRGDRHYPMPERHRHHLPQEQQAGIWFARRQLGRFLMTAAEAVSGIRKGHLRLPNRLLLSSTAARWTHCAGL
jgi:hypothetical protein